MKLAALGLLVVVLGIMVFGVYRMFREASLSQQVSPELGLFEGRFKDCSSAPNCVNSYASSEDHGISALPGKKPELEALAEFVAEAPGAKISVLSENYVRAEFKSSLFGFVDDLELYFDGNLIQVRSASRVGYSDLGANRARVENLRSFLETR